MKAKTGVRGQQILRYHVGEGDQPSPQKGDNVSAFLIAWRRREGDKKSEKLIT